VEKARRVGVRAIQSERREKPMPKALEHAIIWEEEHQQYQLLPTDRHSRVPARR